jgi:hypothetical protein
MARYAVTFESGVDRMDYESKEFDTMDDALYFYYQCEKRGINCLGNWEDAGGMPDPEGEDALIKEMTAAADEQTQQMIAYYAGTGFGIPDELLNDDGDHGEIGDYGQPTRMYRGGCG